MALLISEEGKRIVEKARELFIVQKRTVEEVWDFIKSRAKSHQLSVVDIVLSLDLPNNQWDELYKLLKLETVFGYKKEVQQWN